MNAKTVGLALLTLAVIGLAWKVSEDKAPQTEMVRTYLHPGLIDRLNDVGRVHLKSAEHETILVRDHDAWKVENRDGYPAEFARVKRAVLQMAELKLVEEKTTIPENYPRIGVADIDSDEADGTLIELTTDTNEAIAALLIGNALNTGARKQHYVRKLGDQQSWLVAGELDISAETYKWHDSDIADIDTQRVKQVSIQTQEGETILVAKSDSSKNYFELANIPEGYEAKSKATISSIGAILLSLKFNDVASATRVGQLTSIKQIELQTFDGLVATLEEFELEGRSLVRFDFSFDPELLEAEDEEEEEDVGEAETADGEDEMGETSAAEAVADEAARLKKSTAQWVYELPDYKMRTINKRFEDLIKESEAPDESKDE
ncbi:MAG: DUF4340 domain-containing protein [Proteobacteria bacterium]|nr:DUF4340 domain-containing protein [Pseudomonadota bacterium]